jgi:hypothetical protein
MALLAFLLAALSMRAQPATVPEYKLKAAVLFNLAKFIDWPTNTFAQAEAPFVVGVIGDDPFGPLLEDTLRQQTVHGRKATVRRLAAGDDLSVCHILFVSRSERLRTTTILAQVSRAPVLTVSETDGFAEAGGMVNLVLQDGLVRFEINRGAADARGLQISSKVLKYARLVTTQRPLPEVKP